MRFTYKQKLFGAIFILFSVFLICVIISEQREQKEYRTKNLETKLDSYVEIIHKYIEKNKLTDQNMNQLAHETDLLPKDMRVTIVNREGKAIYDNGIINTDTLKSHIYRPELMKAQYQNFGTNIRWSESTNQEYIYYARLYENYFVRVALPYNVKVQNLLRPDNIFNYIMIVLFIIILGLVYYITGRFGKSIIHLKDLTTRIKENKCLPEKLYFADDELGAIGLDLVDISRQKEKARQIQQAEQDKFVQHFRYAEIGLGIFSSERKKISANTHFIQYFNLIVNTPTFDIDSMFDYECFRPVRNFLKEDDRNYFSYQLEKNGKVFLIQVIMFEDKSFEVTIKDNTKIEKNRLLKQKMTNNIAHELRTPVTSLRGYLETLNDNELPPEKQKQFINKAYLQSLRLSGLIEDIGLLSKIETASTQFVKAPINLWEVINEVRIDLSDKIEKSHVKLNISVDQTLIIWGNYTLIYSVFRNLVDNSLNYGGENIEIYINNYMRDNIYVYFSYCDTGKGVAEEHINHLFERFYRVDNGRTRNCGGSGLGLSIVKNAILLHHGDIQARMCQKGGLEFLFTLESDLR